MPADYPDTALDAALMYRLMPWRVAPLAPGSKVPTIRDWVNGAATDVDQIHRWWNTEENPDACGSCGICIVTGRKSGVWVLDVDVANGKAGMETLKALIADHGGGARLPETLVVRTPSGGYHYYFTYPADAEVHNSASNRLGAGLDVRGEGGQVNAPPTVRGEGSYRWADGRGPYDAEVAEAPAWLLDLVKDQPRQLGLEAPAAVPVHTPAVALAISREAQQLGGDTPGFVTEYNERNDWAALLTAEGWAFSHTDNQGVSYWARPGKTTREGISASTNFGGSDLLYVWSTSIPWLDAERAYDKYGYHVRRHHGGDFDAAARHFVAKRRQAQQLAPSTTGAALPAPAAAPPAAPPAPPVQSAPESPGQIGDAEKSSRPDGVPSDMLEPAQGRPPVDEAEHSRYELLRIDFASSGPFWNIDLDASDWLLEPLLARGRGHALYASAKAGKSFVVLQAVAAACVPNHPSWAVTPKELLTVVYLDYEMTEADLRERLEAFGYGPADDYSRLHYIRAGALGADLDTYEGGQDLARQALAWGADLVVVDTLSRAVRGEENDADTMRDFYRFTGSPLKALGISVLRLDHAGKDRERGQRGTSGKNDDVDVVWRLERTDDGAKLILTHARVGWMPAEINLRHVEGEDLDRIVRVDGDGYAAGTRAKADEWLAAGIPIDASRRQATAAGLRIKASLFGSVQRFLHQEAERAAAEGVL